MQSEKLSPTDHAGAALVRSTGLGENLEVHGHYTVACVGADGQLKWADTIENLVVTVGKNDLLDKYLAGTTYTAAWYMGLVDNTSFTAYAAGDTLASHTGWLEIATGTGYTAGGSATNRATVGWNAASAGSKASTTTAFAITASITVLGALLTTTQARGTSSNGGVGVLYSAGSFSGGARVVTSGDTLNVTYTASV
jgi:hypothetical protein